jgi:hypothetical protein
MAERRLATIALAGFLASVVHAGEIKIHRWPRQFVQDAVRVCDIPVVMDTNPVRFSAIRIVAGPLKLQPVGVGIYEGCRDLLVSCSHNVTLHCSIEPTGAVDGNYSASLANPDVDAPGGTTQLCVKLIDARVEGLLALKNVQVAVVKIGVSVR